MTQEMNRGRGFDRGRGFTRGRFFSPPGNYGRRDGGKLNYTYKISFLYYIVSYTKSNVILFGDNILFWSTANVSINSKCNSKSECQQ